jgi:acetyl-CoA acetyltransferase
MPHPFRDVAIAGVFNTEQARKLEGRDAQSVAVEGALGALADAGIAIEEVDGVAGQFAADMVLGARMGPCSRKLSTHGIPTVLEAASMIAFGECEVVVIGAGGAAMYTERSATAPWTRPANELVVGFGLFTAAEFALMARRHMLQYGTTPDQLALAAATVRNNGHVNPEAVYFGRGPFTLDDILGSSMFADPVHLLE